MKYRLENKKKSNERDGGSLYNDKRDKEQIRHCNSKLIHIK